MFYERTAKDAFMYSMEKFMDYFRPSLKKFRRASELRDDFKIERSMCEY